MTKASETTSSSSAIQWSILKAVAVIGIGLSLFELYTAGVIAMTAMKHRSIFLTSILVIAFLTRPLYKGARRDRLNGALCIDLILVAMSVAVGAYIFIDLNGIFERQGDWSQWDITVGIVLVLLVLEATRRVIGLNLTCIASGFLLFGYFGPYMPDLLMHKGYSIERMATTLSLTTEGIFGLPTGVAATFVFIFILFGSFLEKTGAGSFFIDMAYSITGRFSGGPAKTAVVASGFMGSVAGSAIANVVATGSFTIPMMKKIGYRPHVAAAVEAAASTGGQLMPPIMGAGAFLMAEFTQTPYLEIIKIAFIPALLYFFSVILFVHLEAQKEGIWGQPKEVLPRMGKTIKKGIHFIIPVGILITVLVMNYSPMMAGFIAILAIYFTALLRKDSRISITTLLKTLEQGARNAVVVGVACAAAGIIVGVVNLTGTGLRFSSLIVSLSQGIPLLALGLVAVTSLLLGMGLPVTASYIVLVILAGPALMDLGIPLLTAHMIVFWYSQDANITPPVALESFAASGIAGSSPMRTAFTSWKLAKGLYIIPIVMAYHPLLLNGTTGEVVQTVIFCTVAITAFVICLERYFLVPLTWVETILYGGAAIAQIWANDTVNYIGLIIFLILAAYQIVAKRKAPDPKTRNPQLATRNP
ncbi:MAG: TRAP transporter permease [Desulfobacteraceae bacterium]|uniref:TRAP transporter permease n=1 Tax=Candidatus Desulfacyla euxinica TaxID=2841693 RepID=A0A8J6N0Z7_9DELT|nr:TRAP transporter permease [Candidatus Desulfacyla euxinica]MBL6979218.1 TRAP transporter permease [Desulfobacteraceae bacterium]MBL7216264.1 TRAP transporter permease [Desulfobacteraceae bacterium]